MINQTRRLIDIAVNEFNYILDINLNYKRVEQIVSNIPQISNGISYKSFVGTFGSNVPLVDKAKCELFVDRIENALETKNYTPFVAEIRFQNLIDKSKFDWSSIKCIFDTSKEDVHVFVISRDITVEKENELEVIRSSQKDSLTGLLNRYAYNYIAKSTLVTTARDNSKVAFFFIDIDNFKKINDVFGHQEGDKVLKNVAMLLKDIFGSKAIISRYGGDEFIVIVPSYDTTEEIKNLGKTLCDEFTNIKTNKASFIISCSVGISLFPMHSQDLDELIRFSDLALYKAKSLGKNQYYIFDKDKNDTDIAYSQIKQENRIVEHYELLDVLLSKSDTAIVVTDPKTYKFIYANEAYSRMFNIPEEDVRKCDKPCYSVINGYLEPCKSCEFKKNHEEKRIVHRNNKLYLRSTYFMDIQSRIVIISYYSEILSADDVEKIEKIHSGVQQSNLF